MLLKPSVWIPAFQLTACPIPHTGKGRLHIKKRWMWHFWWGFFGSFLQLLSLEALSWSPERRRRVPEGHSHGCSADQGSLMDCRGSATGISLCQVCFHPIPCNPPSLCPHPNTGRTSALQCVPRTGGECGWSQAEQTLPCLVLPSLWKATASCASAFLRLPMGMHIPNKSCCVLAPQSRGCCWMSSADGTGWHHTLELSS